MTQSATAGPRRQPGLEQLGVALWADPNRLGAHVTVHEPVRVHFGERIGELDSEIDGGAHMLWPGGHDLSERLTRHELDGEVRCVAAVPDIEHRGKIRV